MKGRWLFTLLLTLLVSIGLAGSAVGIPPTLVVPSNFSVEASSPAGAPVNYIGLVSAQLPPYDTIISCGPIASGSNFPLNPPGPSTTITCTATVLPTGGLDWESTGSFVVTVQDTTPPVISGTPIQVGAMATVPSGTAVTYPQPTASDIVDGARPVTCVPASGSSFPVGTTTVTCSASDTRGNDASTSFPVIVTYLTEPPPTEIAGPSLTVPDSPLVVEATSAAGAIVRYSASSADTPAPTILCSPAPGSQFPLGDTIVTCNAKRPGGIATTTKSFTVRVRDATAPSFAKAPADVVRRAPSRKGVAVTYRQPLATDLVDGTLASVCKPRPGSVFKPGSKRVTCTATDSHGNRRSVSFRVRVLLEAGPLIAPASGARLSGPPLLRWKPVKGASYYNVQVWKGERKLLSAWPRAGRLRLHKSWTYNGFERRLSPGTYTWYVWPGYGRQTAASYGKMLGKRTFRIVG